MCIFNIFKKKKKAGADVAPAAETLSQESLQWNKMWDLWAEGKIESPYGELMEYLNGINDGGHFCHFDNVSSNANLKEYVNALSQILPEPLKSNVTAAYKAYIINPDDITSENEQILEDCDHIYYANESLINQILTARASKIEL